MEAGSDRDRPRSPGISLSRSELRTYQKHRLPLPWNVIRRQHREYWGTDGSIAVPVGHHVISRAARTLKRDLACEFGILVKRMESPSARVLMPKSNLTTRIRAIAMPLVSDSNVVVGMRTDLPDMLVTEGFLQSPVMRSARGSETLIPSNV